MQVLFAVFLGLIFLSTYAIKGEVGGSVATNPTNTTTTIAPSTAYAFGTANAVILNYSNNLQILVSCGNSSSAVLNFIQNTILPPLQSNNSVQNSYPIGNKILIETGNMAPVKFYKYSISQMNQSSASCSSFLGTANVQLPSPLNLTLTGQQRQSISLPINASTRLRQLPVSLGYNSSTIGVKIAALIESNGAIYELNLTTGA